MQGLDQTLQGGAILNPSPSMKPPPPIGERGKPIVQKLSLQNCTTYFHHHILWLCAPSRYEHAVMNYPYILCCDNLHSLWEDSSTSLGRPKAQTDEEEYGQEGQWEYGND